MEALAFPITQSLPPGPRKHPLVTAYRWLRQPLEYLEEASEQYGDPFTMRLPGFPAFVVFKNPDSVAEVFQDNGETMLGGKFYQALRGFLGEHSVLMLDRAPHRRIRKLLLPPFHGERMQAYGQVMIDLTHDSIDHWPANRRFSAYDKMQAVTLKTIVRAIMGFDEGPLCEDLVKKLTQLTSLAAWRPLLLPFMQVDLGPLSPWGRFKRKEAQVSRALLDEIDRRRTTGTAGRTDVLSLLLDARDEHGQPMSDDELRDELHTLLFAGHETTATSLAWALYHIHASADVEERLRAEVTGAAGPGGRLTSETVNKLPYLDAVVRESLRMIPAVPLAGRVLDRDAAVGGHRLPKGTAVICSIYLAHRRAQLYPDPGRFQPERFLGTKFSPSEYFPFGGGIRRCIGMAFALYEMKMVLAAVMLRTRLELADAEVRIERRVTLKPSHGLRIIMTERRPRETT